MTQANEPNPYQPVEPAPPRARGYEPPQITVLGTLAELTQGQLGGNSDTLSPGSKF